MAQVTDLYERNYINAWNELLNDLAIVPFSTVEQYREALGILGGPTSPLRRVLSLVAEHTSFVQPAARRRRRPRTAPQSGNLAGSRRTRSEGPSRRRSRARRACQPGRSSRERFQPIHQLMAGAPAPIDGVLDLVRKIRDRLLQVGAAGGRAKSAERAHRSGVARSQPRPAARVGESAAAGQRAGRPDCPAGRSQRQIRRDRAARAGVSGPSRRALSRPS